MAAVVLPDFSQLGNPRVWTMAVTLCMVASLETLLSLEAVDRLDPLRRISPPNRELVAQGVGNMASGLLGGLPITAVIVRSSANVMAGGRTQLSAMVHGVLLLLSVLLLAPLLNRVPLASLAVVLLLVGFKLTPLSLWKAMWRAGRPQFVPFVVTVVAIVATDLLKGTFIGLAVGLFFAVRAQQRNAILVTREGGVTTVRFTKDMTFLQKARLKDVLRAVQPGTTVVIDRSVCDFVDDDIEELLLEFSQLAPGRRITVREEVPPEAQARRAMMQPAH
jgi:MFS superfamily sulfate permease-like transporter